MWKKLNTFLLILLIACGGNIEQENRTKSISDMTWEEIESRSAGKTVTWMMWQGDPQINAYIRGYVVPEVKNRYNITLEVVPGQGSTIVQVLMKEIEAGRQESEIDMVWINGETFYQLRQIDALYGPFTEQLPNSRFIDYENRFIQYDFQQKVDGFEVPWGNVQMTLIYDSARTSDPPSGWNSLEEFVRNNPGRFTIPNEFTGMTFLKVLMYELAKEPAALHGEFNKQLYDSLSAVMWTRINRIKPFFWRAGKTYPGSLAALHQLFASGEVLITMSNNDSEVDNKINQGVFQETARAYVWDTGTIQNSHYIGIPAGASNKAAALVVANFLISAEAQLKKYDPLVWGDGTVLDISRLPDSIRRSFLNVRNRRYAPLREEIGQRALMEPDPKYMVKLYEDFRKEVIEK